MSDWKDEETLNELYHGEGMTTREVADELGCNAGTVVYWMDKFGIDRRDQREEHKKSMMKNPARFETYSKGYERWVTQIDGSKEYVRVHRLLAVAEYGFDAVRDMAVHHENHIPWDNRAENIGVMNHSEHSKLHNPDGSDPRERWRLR